MGIFDTGALDGNAILELNPNIAFYNNEQTFGGAGRFTEINRELTDIETTITEKMILKLLGNMREPWENIIELNPKMRANRNKSSICSNCRAKCSYVDIWLPLMK